MEDTFQQVAERIFSNWTALKLAVEHNMGGPNGRQVAIDIVNYMAQYCLSDVSIAVADIEEALEDIMDEEFDTICEDNSVKDVANVLYKFAEVLRKGDVTQYEIELNKLPPTNDWLLKPLPQKASQVQQDSSSDEEVADDGNMEVDSEWTEVKSRRKR